MLHAEFQQHRTSGSGVDVVLKGFTIYMCTAAILVMWP